MAVASGFRPEWHRASPVTPLPGTRCESAADFDARLICKLSAVYGIIQQSLVDASKPSGKYRYHKVVITVATAAKYGYRQL